MRLVHPSSLVHPSVIIGKDTKIGPFCNIMAGCNIGNNTRIGQNVFLDQGVSVGNNVSLGNNVSICSGTIIMDEVYIGSSVVFSEVLNPRNAAPNKKQACNLVKNSARISPNVTIIQGNNIGKYAFVGAGAVITKPVFDYALIVGNPSKQVGWVSEKGCKLVFSEEKAECLFSNEIYKIHGRTVKKITEDQMKKTLD